MSVATAGQKRIVIVGAYNGTALPLLEVNPWCEKRSW
jgi:hypothetical protein